ncbi:MULTISPECIES: late competence protein ComER [Bacillus]|uniref:late competence protein ComER n=1 Tax=Bacillus TaxID=1386 RepID=UPI000C75F5F5|nr:MULTISPECIES: late competence protein ComER [Bacillus]PLR87664.1 late competence protein ComER [Bacillus sp. V33-4]RSK56270.1 late competence protein ComER [Bacillus canaveralius]
MRVGIIGTGNMGRILAEAMIEGKAVPPSSMTITNRTKLKALDIQAKFKDITVTDQPAATAQMSDLIFISVKPHDIRQVLREIHPHLSADKCVVSITSPISTGQLEQAVPCSVARVIPSITNRALAGVSLVTFGERCDARWKDGIWNLFLSVSVPVEIEENITRVASDIVSCGPAFFSYLVQRFIKAAEKETEIDAETATKLTSEMLIGLGELLKKDIFTLPALQEKVCVKGGITGEGIKILESELGDIFEHVFAATHEKFREDLKGIEKQFPSQIN